MAKAMEQVSHPLFARAFDGTAWKIEDRAKLSDGPIGPGEQWRVDRSRARDHGATRARGAPTNGGGQQ